MPAASIPAPPATTVPTSGSTGVGVAPGVPAAGEVVRRVALGVGVGDGGVVAPGVSHGRGSEGTHAALGLGRLALGGDDPQVAHPGLRLVEVGHGDGAADRLLVHGRQTGEGDVGLEREMGEGDRPHGLVDTLEHGDPVLVGADEVLPLCPGVARIDPADDEDEKDGGDADAAQRPAASAAGLLGEGRCLVLVGIRLAERRPAQFVGLLGGRRRHGSGLGAGADRGRADDLRQHARGRVAVEVDDVGHDDGDVVSRAGLQGDLDAAVRRGARIG